MASKIGWTTETCNVFTGCRHVSAGCAHCYAETMAKRLKGSGHPSYQEVVDGRGWTGRVQTNFAALQKICRMPKPRRVFICSMSDFFYEAIPDSLRDAALGLMRRAGQHVFQILTKRPQVALRYYEGLCAEYAARGQPSPFGDDTRHLWHGVTCEHQAAAETRIPLLLEIPSAVRFVSCEPLLEPIDLMPWLACVHDYSGVYDGCGPDPRLDWVIVGCESINGRPGRFCGEEFYRALASLREQCAAAGVALFVKQVPDPANRRVIHDSGVIAERLSCRVEDVRQWPPTAKDPQRNADRTAKERQ